MNIVRKLKLSKLSGIDYLSYKEKEIVNFVNSKLLDLSEFTVVEYPHLIFYMNKYGENILQYDIEDKYFLIRKEIFFNLQRSNYLTTSDDVINILQYALTSKLKLEVSTVDIIPEIIVGHIEKSYKKQIALNI